MTNTVTVDKTPSGESSVAYHFNGYGPVNSDKPVNVRLSNIADGVHANDAATVGQVGRALDAAGQQIRANAVAIREARRELRGGVASAVATASLPQPYRPGQNIISVGTGHFQGANSLAVGMSSISDDGHVIFKVNGSVTTGNQTTVGAGVGFVW